ncbi:hypothetical protein [Novosphingobium sp. 9]|uniref:hypothetical protein n=1 Tax=Novosphingobium sp. 9 TaxID=2025349 RepID=UPI0021B54C4E|nr:hypothetical protein [Novosphingobium sp. 9]
MIQKRVFPGMREIFGSGLLGPCLSALSGTIQKQTGSPFVSNISWIGGSLIISVPLAVADRWWDVESAAERKPRKMNNPNNPGPRRKGKAAIAIVIIVGIIIAIVFVGSNIGHFKTLKDQERSAEKG